MSLHANAFWGVFILLITSLIGILLWGSRRKTTGKTYPRIACSLKRYRETTPEVAADARELAAFVDQINHSRIRTAIQALESIRDLTESTDTIIFESKYPDVIDEAKKLVPKRSLGSYVHRLNEAITSLKLSEEDLPSRDHLLEASTIVAEKLPRKGCITIQDKFDPDCVKDLDNPLSGIAVPGCVKIINPRHRPDPRIVGAEDRIVQSPFSIQDQSTEDHKTE